MLTFRFLIEVSGTVFRTNLFEVVDPFPSVGFQCFVYFFISWLLQKGKKNRRITKEREEMKEERIERRED
jgi:hypothetical protein